MLRRSEMERFSVSGSDLLVAKRIIDRDVLSEIFGPAYRDEVRDTALRVGIRDPLVFFDKPKAHEKSQAVYLVEQVIGDDLVLVSALGKSGISSRHKHVNPMRGEEYHWVKGTLSVDMDGKEIELDQDTRRIEVPLDVWHQVRVGEDPALTLIVMKGAGPMAPEARHIRER